MLINNFKIKTMSEETQNVQETQVAQGAQEAQEAQVSQNIEETKRPAFLTVLCILSFVGSGISLLGILLFTVAAGALGGMLKSIPGMGALMGAGIGLSIGLLILNAGTLFGAIKMWKLEKMGFYIYVAAYLLQVILPLIFGMPFSALSLLWPVVFIVLYGLNLKHLK